LERAAERLDPVAEPDQSGSLAGVDPADRRRRGSPAARSRRGVSSSTCTTDARACLTALVSALPPHSRRRPQRARAAALGAQIELDLRPPNGVPTVFERGRTPLGQDRGMNPREISCSSSSTRPDPRQCAQVVLELADLGLAPRPPARRFRISDTSCCWVRRADHARIRRRVSSAARPTRAREAAGPRGPRRSRPPSPIARERRQAGLRVAGRDRSRIEPAVSRPQGGPPTMTGAPAANRGPSHGWRQRAAEELSASCRIRAGRPGRTQACRVVPPKGVPAADMEALLARPQVRRWSSYCRTRSGPGSHDRQRAADRPPR